MELTNLEKELYTSIRREGFVSNLERISKTAAAICENKMREAIDLAREGSYEGVSTYSKWRFDHTKEEIIKLLTEQKDK